MAGCKKYSTVHCKGVVGARRLECAGKAELMAVSHPPPFSPVSLLPLSHGWMDRRKRKKKGGWVPGMKLAWLTNVCGVHPLAKYGCLSTGLRLFLLILRIFLCHVPTMLSFHGNGTL